MIQDDQSMPTPVDEALASLSSDYTVGDQLHAVPPHEVYEVTVDDQRAVLKRSVGPTGSAGIEGRVMDFVASATTLPVPAVLATGGDWFVAAYHRDAPPPTVEGPPDTDWAKTAGRTLGRLHEETAPHVDEYGPFVVDDNELVVDGHDDFSEEAIAYVQRHRPVLERYGHGDIADAILAVVEERPAAFADVDGPVCCHGWMTPEHLSIVDGEPRCLLDFEHAIAAPPLFDYWRAVVPTFGPGDPGVRQQAFRRGYEAVRELPADMDERWPYFQLLQLTYYFESLYVQDQHDADETERRAKGMCDLVHEVIESLPE